MAELDGGTSDTTPTRRRSTSCLTRIDRQKGHVVWTALDQRKVISPPQLGQAPLTGTRDEAGDATGLRKHVPHGVSDRRQAQLLDDQRKEGPHSDEVGDARRVAPARVNDPFAAAAYHAR